MKNKTKLFGLTAAMILVATSAAGCSNRRSGSVVVPDVIALSQLTSKYSASNKLQIDFWTGFGKDITGTLETLITKFETEYPYIDVVHESKGGYSGLSKAVNLAITSRKYPQVVLGYPDHFAGYISNGIQCDLSGYIESRDENISLDITDFNTDFLEENLTLAYKDEAKTDPYVMGLPFNKSTEVMIYNQTLFDFFEITVPTTWDQVKTVSQTFIDKLSTNIGGKTEVGNLFGKKIYKTEDGDVYYGYGSGASATVVDANGNTATLPLGLDPLFDFSGVTQDDFYPVAYDSQANFFITELRQWGSEYTELGDSIEQGYIKFDNPESRAMMTYFRDMENSHYLGIPRTWEEESYCSNPFKALKAAMTISSSAGLSYNIAAGAAFRVGIAPVPYKDASNKYVISQGTNIAMLRSTAEKNLASWLLIKYLTTEANVEFAIETGYLPVTISGENSETYQDFLSQRAGTDAERARIAAAKVANEVYGNEGLPADSTEKWTKFIDPAFRGSSTVRNEVEAAMPMALERTAGGTYRYTVDEVIEYLYRQLNLYVKRD